MKNKKRPIAVWVIIVMILLMAAIGTFVYNYTQLKDSLAVERTVYISELSEQLADKVNHLQKQFSQVTCLYANLLNINQPETFEEVAALFHDSEEFDEKQVLLVNSDGNIYNLKKEIQYIDNIRFIYNLIYNRQRDEAFERNSKGKEVWIFGCPIDNEIEKMSMKAVLISYDEGDFQTNFALELFNQEGYSFIVDENGAIVIGVQTQERVGYNLLSSFREMGMDDTIRQRIQDDLKSYKSGQVYAQFSHATWLLQYNLLDNQKQYVFVLVPVSITAAAPLHHMNKTLLTGLLMILILAGVLFAGMLLSARSNRKKDAAVYQAKLLAKSAEAKGDFMSRMSHDIRTPLNAIIGMNYIAMENLNDRGKVENCLKKMNFSANYLLELINDVLDMQKIESGKLGLNIEPFSIKELMESGAAIIRARMEEKGIQFSINGLDIEHVNYMGDKLRISQILMNLLSNANKFTDKGGAVTLGVDIQKGEEGKDYVTFSVEDTGIGISKEYEKRLFKPFEQESSATAIQYGGSGLGLSIAYNLVTLMNGNIEVSSKIGEGSCFKVILPLERTENKPVKIMEKEKKSIQSLAGRRVLLVEDNEINMEIATEILRMQGMEVEVAENGKIGLDLFCQSEAGWYQYIVTDIRMPIMDGYELSRAVRMSGHEDASSILIFAMSANAFDEDVKKSKAFGMNEHLKKPIVVEEVLAAFQKYDRQLRNDSLSKSH